jgi:4-amino-4-deoxy-L-arabinose transferase-like glycosyltransferase
MQSELLWRRRIDVLCLIVVLLSGIFLRLPHSAFTAPGSPLHALARLHPEPKWLQLRLLGVDEGLYIGYVTDLSNHGLSAYPAIVAHYIELQEKRIGSFLPPTRFLYIFTSYLWHRLFGGDVLTALHAVASCFSILTLCLSGVLAWRMGGRAAGLAVLALMAFAPMQLHMSQHVLVDGFFTFWALLCLWLLWENLRAPRDWRWLASYILALALLVLTKENSFFVWVGLVAIIVSHRWLRFGTVTREVVLATVIGPLLGVVVLVFLAGGLDTLIYVYRLSVTKNYQVTYAILTGDGPWYRYLVDLLLVSPLVLILALGRLFALNRTKTPELFLAIFVAASYLVMCNVKYGMNLRYANMWDMPLRYLAFSQLSLLTVSAKRYQVFLAGALVGVIALLDLRQYIILAVNYPLYELVTHELLRALSILKSP